jgi:hypothetical protein
MLIKKVIVENNGNKRIKSFVSDLVLKFLTEKNLVAKKR